MSLHIYMINATDLRNGTTFELDGKPYLVLNYSHTKLGRGGATVRVQIRNLKTGAVEERTFGPTEKVASVNLVRRKMQYLYSDDSAAFFMDPVTFEQEEMNRKGATEQIRFLKDGQVVNLLFINNEPLLIELPPKVTLSIKDTVPGVRGNSATNIWKPAALENGLQVKVPLFIKTGDEIIVDTRTGEYVGRAGK